MIKGKRVTERIFDGLKVIDCASFIAGPAAATVMSDFGAAVIKIEPPGSGDPYRRRATPPIGQSVLRRLVGDADVFITNYPPPVRRRLGITYEELAPLNERLIYASFTGYGEVGPEADKPGFDATAWWARTGLMHLVRAGEEATPARSLPGMGDHPSAMATYGAIVTALYQRERTGKGGYVGSSLLANGLWANGCSVQAALRGDKVVPQPPRERGLNALRVHYRCRDGRWLLLSIAADEWRWEKLKECLAASVLDETRVATVASREAHARELIMIMDSIFAIKDQAEWRAILDAAGLIFGIVADMDEIAGDAQILASEALVPFADGSSLTVNSPIWIRGQEKVKPRPAPAVGEHSEGVLREAGFNETEIRALREEGVIT